MISLLLTVLLTQADAGVEVNPFDAPIYAECPDDNCPSAVELRLCSGGKICQVLPVEGDPRSIAIVPFDSWPFDGESKAYLLSGRRTARVACLLGACETDRLEQEDILDTTDPGPTWHYWAIGLGGAAIIGAIIGYSYATLSHTPTAPR